MFLFSGGGGGGGERGREREREIYCLSFKTSGTQSQECKEGNFGPLHKEKKKSKKKLLVVSNCSPHALLGHLKRKQKG